MKLMKQMIKALLLCTLVNLVFINVSQAAPIDQLSNDYRLVLFYSSNCIHCQRFVPTFKSAVNTYHLNYYAFSVDGQSLEPVAAHSYPATQKVMDNFYGQLPRMWPAVFLINVNTMAFTLVSTGELSDAEFANNLNSAALTLIKDSGVNQ
jgi:thiol-disulfide isomerase/thioredoxin